MAAKIYCNHPIQRSQRLSLIFTIKFEAQVSLRAMLTTWSFFFIKFIFHFVWIILWLEFIQWLKKGKSKVKTEILLGVKNNKWSNAQAIKFPTPVLRALVMPCLRCYTYSCIPWTARHLWWLHPSLLVVWF